MRVLGLILDGNDDRQWMWVAGEALVVALAAVWLWRAGTSEDDRAAILAVLADSLQHEPTADIEASWIAEGQAAPRSRPRRQVGHRPQ